MPPCSGRTDRSVVPMVSGIIIRTIARPLPLPVPPLFPPSRPLGGWAGTGRCRPKPLCAKGKGYPFALSPSHWSYRSLRCVRGTKFPSRPGRATRSDAMAVLNRHLLISTRRAPCAARRARSDWAKRDREHAARSISTSCTWRAKYGLPDWTLGLYDCYNRFTWIRELSLLQRQLRE